MNNKFPYQNLLRDKTVGDWEAFKRINFQLQEKAKRRESIAEEIFGIKIVLDEQWSKWFVIASNHSRTNEQTREKVTILWNRISTRFENQDNNELFTRSGYWKRNRVKVFLQTFNLDFFFYGDSLRTNLEREGTIKTIFNALRRNLALSTWNNLFFYGVPIFLMTIHPLYIILLLASAVVQGYFSYRRTIKFYYLNEINKKITQPNNV